MITFLDSVGPAVLRASWQAVVLAVVVLVIVRSLGERVSPRWRYLLWSVVLVRMLWVATPASPWSAFNLVRWNTPASEPRVVVRDAVPTTEPTPTPTNERTVPTTERVEITTYPQR